MTFRRFLFLLVIILLVFLYRPSTLWQEGKRAWAQRELILRVLVTVILVYLLYGVYRLYDQGWLTW